MALPDLIDRSTLRDCVASMAGAASFAQAEAALDVMARAIGMPMMAWAPDIGRPHFDGHMDAFLRRHGWPEDMLDLWWNRHVMLRMPLYIRCRFEHLPFVSLVRSGMDERSAVERAIEAAMSGFGLVSMLTAPVQLPRGRIAMLTWVTDLDRARVEAVAEVAGPELLAAGHWFMAAFDREIGRIAAEPEELSHLTPREWDCLRLVAQGHRDAEIARLNQLSPTTVRYHLDNVVRKLGAENRVHAVALAAQLGMLGAIGR